MIIRAVTSKPDFKGTPLYEIDCLRNGTRCSCIGV